MQDLRLRAGQKLAVLQQGRASVPSPRSLTIAFSALLFWSDVATVGQQDPVPLSGQRKIRATRSAVACALPECLPWAFCARLSDDPSRHRGPASPAASGSAAVGNAGLTSQRRPGSQSDGQCDKALTNKGLSLPQQQRRARCLAAPSAGPEIGTQECGKSQGDERAHIVIRHSRAPAPTDKSTIRQTLQL